ncbi:MAG: tRNA (uridine(34)/cytosine(34)/5-carboxymethylaminomethyluridine(34)-2'-O)-methyltransferase TrmL [Gammaproteobacteria bacterium]|nr:MAG: tRNA (uridine(34)/cytosine(34)/5-carboxymethylaminomethyluridine(34)-2'-O)-methyltransferase TrmL [Gammaproteobacteria bacterium]RLA59731.1 MAG: tRNA (uridine(34)/cytosine(34)/5-carboxymethylaminomethyluridine(34)-2'-O)-methyltransferase TrmL [Gammaproteobacteria bacterium]
MLKIVLFQPEIPPNTGNIIRLCANTGCSLHLIEPLGFDLEDKKMRRAGLDYREFANIQLYPDLASFKRQQRNPRLFAATTKGATLYHQIAYRAGDAILFGPETRGLPEDILGSLNREQRIRIPMKQHSRSLNLSNATALVAYEGLRQLGFPGLD